MELVVVVTCVVLENSSQLVSSVLSFANSERVTVLLRLSVKLPISILLVVQMRNLPILMIDVNQCAKISDWVRTEQTVVLDRLSRDVTVKRATLD